MNLLKLSGATAIAVGQVSREDWLFIISIVLTLLGMLQEYMQNRKTD